MRIGTEDWIVGMLSMTVKEEASVGCGALLTSSVSSNRSNRESPSISSSLSLSSSRVGPGVGLGGGTLADCLFLGTALGANREVDLMTDAETGV